MRTLLLAAVLLVPTSLISADGFAQTEDDYRTRMSEAVAEFDAHRFVEARALFRRAHGISPSAQTLRGIGLASFELGDYVEAHRALSASLTDRRSALTDEQRAVVSEILSKAVRFMGHYASQGAAIELTEAPPRDAVTGGQGAAIEFTEAPPRDAVTGGQGAAIEFTEAPPPPTERASTETPPPPPTERASALGARRVACVFAAYFGLASALTLIGAGTAWVGAESDLRECDELGDACLDRDDRVSSWETAAITTVTSASFLLASIVLYFLNDDWREEEAELACAPFGLGVGCVGRF